MSSKKFLTLSESPPISKIAPARYDESEVNPGSVKARAYYVELEILNLRHAAGSTSAIPLSI